MSSNKFNNNERHQGPCTLGSAAGVRELVPDLAQSLGERVSGEVQRAAQSAQTDFGWRDIVLPKNVVPPEQCAPDSISHPALATASCPPDSKGGMAWASGPPNLQGPPVCSVRPRRADTGWRRISKLLARGSDFRVLSCLFGF